MEILGKEADRWLRQSEDDLKAARWCEQGGYYAQACFLAQQSAAKALRAFLFYNKEDARETRSVVELVDRAITYEEEFKPLVTASSLLDLYYKTARFPDAIPGGIPAEVIGDRNAREAVEHASELVELVESKRKSYLPETL
ncbi:MAG TPA: HEPN domain-containing protein [Deltaproteobacteria bacterium]|nr:HEPN domain-containing protein [Deltaproteobacteria bacterium]